MISSPLRLAFCFSFLFFYMGCKTTKSPISKIKNIENYSLKEGIYDTSFTIGNTKDWKMKLAIPKIESGKKYPLSIALHWGGNLTTYQAYADCLAFPGLDTLGGIVVAPSSGGLHWTLPINEERVIGLVKEIKKHWPVDEKKVVVTGYSNGGIGSWFLADKYPELFSAAIPMAGFYRATKLKIPTYVVHGSEDELFSVKEVEKVVLLTQKKSSYVELEIIPNFSHYMGCAYVKVLRRKAMDIKENHFEN